MARFDLVRRCKVFVNTDPQGRCYNGCYFSFEYHWSEWETLESDFTEEEAECRLVFWRDLNAYAVKSRGEGATCEYDLVPAKQDAH